MRSMVEAVEKRRGQATVPPVIIVTRRRIVRALSMLRTKKMEQIWKKRDNSLL